MAAPMQMQNQVPQPQAQNPAANPQHNEIDPISKFKSLLPRLKDSLAVLFRAAGDVFRYHATQDSGARTGESPQNKFEKSLEEFYALCDQMEITLKFALEMHSQLLDSIKYTPYPVMSAIKDNQPTDAIMPYSQYLLTVRTQVNCATEIHDVLTEFSKKLTDQPMMT